MAYYQEDILEEDVATNWGTHVSKKYTDKETSKKVRKAAGPFLTVRRLVSFPLLLPRHADERVRSFGQWLEEADESDSE